MALTTTRALTSPFCHYGPEVSFKGESADLNDVHLTEPSDLLDTWFAKRFKASAPYEQRMILENLVSEIDTKTLTTELAYQIAVRHVEPAAADLIQPALVGVIDATLPPLKHVARSARTPAPTEWIDRRLSE